MTSTDVTVVIPTHNRRDRLGRTLRSALGQIGVDHEVVVVDDGSTDGTAEALASHADPRLRVIRHDMARGVAAARNAGIAAARGRWTAFLDDDDLWAPQKLASQLRALADMPRSAWSAVGSVNVDDSLRIVRESRPPPSGELRGRFRARNVIPAGGSGVLAATDLLRDVGGFDPGFTFVEDLDLWIRLADRTPIASVARPLVAYVLHDANLSVTGLGYEAELKALEGKYGAKSVSTLALRATHTLAQGQRAGAARLLVRLAWEERRPRSALQALVVAGGPSIERVVRRRLPTVAPAWRGEAEAWLSTL